MNRRLLHLFLAAGIVLAFFGCSDKNSNQACIHAVSMNLDKGNYNAVLESSCANAMQKGAAYFGLAGFDITQVINNLSKTGTVSNSTNTQNDLTVYMTALVSHASGTSLAYMDDALNSYGSVTTAGSEFTLDNYKDAQFYISMVDVVKSLSLISIVMPNLLDANGNLNTSCDANGNGVPDDADASACALIASAIISEGASTLSCSGASYVQTGDLTLTYVATGQTVTGTYSGLIISMATSSNGTTSGCTVVPPNTDNTTYKKLLYKNSLGYWAATTTTDLCTDQTGTQWPCPIIQNGAPLDLVSTINQTLMSSVSTLSSSLTGTTDVQQAVNDVQAQACCGCTTTPCPVCTTSCTSQDLANYIQTNLK
ncbi:MAG: hypothetical protein M0Z89_09345 [Nitrospiraceae bacterium]|nr:hypothetical protein [Nitrospiraceae bacterium]